ncbi:MAG TPA: putative LPS assembly protein LptD [Fibrobacteria bacterium]|nr:putative LPS assembly protein LptD [Fibrobacteria bacterium]
MLAALPARAQLHTLDRSVQDSLAAKALADSLRFKADSTRAADDTSGSGSDTVSYSADRIRYRSDRFSLSDKALLTYRGSSLVADSIVFYSRDNVVEAMGAPLIQDPANPPILGYRMRYNLKTKVGEIYYGSSKKDNQTFNGVEIRRQKNGEILIARGDFSTCDLTLDKHYFFYSRRMILEPKSKVLSGPIVMNVGDVPVAILPMMVMPLGSGRRSGLLQPKFGGDQTQGFYLTGLGYYWAINEYTDYMMAGDVIEGQQGTFDRTNLNSQFRYNKRYAYNGSLGGKLYVSEFDLSNPGWSVDYAHDQNVTPDQKQTLKGTGRFQSDPSIVDRNALTEEEKVKQTANATLGYRRQFDWNQATFNADFAQDYNLSTTLLNRDVPNLGFRVSGPLFPKPEDDGPAQSGEDPWYRKLTYNYDNRLNVNMVSRPAERAARGDTSTYVGYVDHLSFSGKYPLLQYFNVTPSVNLSQLWSLNSRGDSADPVRTAWDPGAGDLGEYFAFFNTAASVDTRIYGIAQAADEPWFGKLSGIRHTIIPTVNFTYAPKLDSNPRFLPNPKIGGTAFQEEQKTIGFTLGNEVDLKLAPEGGNDAAAPRATAPGAASAVPATASASAAAPGTAASAAAKKGEPYKLLSASSSINYNFAKDVREWSDIPSVFSIYLTKNVAFTLNARHTLYDDFADSSSRDHLVSPILTGYGFGWRKGIQVGGNFNSGVRIKDTQGFPTGRFETTPWSGDLNYSFDYASTRVGGDDNSPLERIFGANGTFRRTLSHTANGSLKLNPTPGWQMSYDTEYNFSDGKFSKHSFAFHRVLHCWQMDFQWTPRGISEGWNFNIRITDLPDVKLQTSDTRTRSLNR